MNKLSVVILNFNGLNYLEQFLPGVVKRSQPYEVVVADNASTDGSVKFLQEQHPEVKLIRFETNYGFSGGYNEAIKLVESQYIVLLNSDVEVTENWIPPVLEVLEASPDIGAAQPKILDHKNKLYFEYAGGGGGYLDSLAFPFCRGRIFHTIEKDKHQYDDTRDVFWASGSCLFVKREAYLESGGLDEDFFAHMEEIDLCWRLWNLGYRVAVCPKSTIYHVGGGTLDKSQPRKTYLNFRNGLSLMLKNEPIYKLIWKLPLRMALDWLAAVHFSSHSGIKHGFAIIRAHWHFTLAFSGHYKKRKNIVRKRVQTPRYRGLIIWQYFGLGKRKYSEITS
jgi:GT2 family glycosyltransferase